MVVKVQDSRDGIVRRQRRTYTSREPALAADKHTLTSFGTKAQHTINC